MTTISDAAGHVISSGMTALFHNTDRLLLDNAKLTADVLEGTADSGLHPRSKQMLLEEMHAALGSVLDGRKRMVAAHRRMIAIQGRSNLREVDYGCWGDGPSPDEERKSARFFTGARLTDARPA